MAMPTSYACLYYHIVFGTSTNTWAASCGRDRAPVIAARGTTDYPLHASLPRLAQQYDERYLWD